MDSAAGANLSWGMERALRLHPRSDKPWAAAIPSRVIVKSLSQRRARSGLCVTRIVVIPLSEQVEHRLSRGRVEIAGRLVGEQEAGASGEGARDRHALLLAAGQSARSVRTPIGESDARQDLAGHPKRLRFRNS